MGLLASSVALLEDPRGPIYKSLSLSLDHKVLENFWELLILHDNVKSINFRLPWRMAYLLISDITYWYKPVFTVTQCCCPRGKSLSVRILEDQFTSPCPRTLSPRWQHWWVPLRTLDTTLTSDHTLTEGLNLNTASRTRERYTLHEVRPVYMLLRQKCWTLQIGATNKRGFSTKLVTAA